MKLSVIIVNYNVKYFLELALLAAEKAANQVLTEIFVVDNNSNDGSAEMVAQQFSNVILIANKKNVGFATANNQAIKQAKGEYILLLNPDTVVGEYTFLNVIDFMDANAKAGGLGIKMIDGSGQFLPESKRGFPSPAVAFYKTFGLAALFPKSKHFNSYHLGYLDKNKNAEIDVLSGAFMLLRKKTLDKIGLLDEHFFMYGEDIDLSYRIVKSGYKNYYFAADTIIHYKGESTKKGSLNYVKTFYQAMIIFAEKHFKNNAFWLILLLRFAIYFRAFITLFSNFISFFWLPFLDFLAIFVGLFLLKNIWAVAHFHDSNYFPNTLLYINFPIYISTWLICIYLRGGYDKGSRFSAVFAGLLFGTLLVSAIYGFLPAELRYSRMLIVLGMFWSVISLAALRIFINIFKHKSIFYNANKYKNLAIIADEKESQRLLNLLYKSRLDFNFIGTISTEITTKEAQKNDNLGHIDNIYNLIDMYKISELIFCAKNINYNQIIAIMEKTPTNIFYKIVAPDSNYIIGSNSKNSNGELYTVDLSFKIAQPTEIRNKKILNFSLAFAFILFLPLVILLVENKFNFIKNCFSVLFFYKNWVGYSAEFQILPPLKTAILSPTSVFLNYNLDKKNEQKICFFYAKDYNVYSDLDIILKCFKQLGNVRK